MRYLMGWVILGVSLSVQAAGPAVVAKADRRLWPEALTTAQAYDKASRHEILAFAAALGESEAFDDAALMMRLRLKQAPSAHLDSFREKTWLRVLQNLQAAQITCAANADTADCVKSPDVAALKAHAKTVAAQLPAERQSWWTMALAFHRHYLDEQLRLAALFPRISSEIEVFSTEEITGHELADGVFQLSFDDGPSRAGGNTDKTLAMLNRAGLHATFFQLGERLQAERQRDLKKEFAGHCLASHGMQHQSHAKADSWRASLLDSKKRLEEIYGDAAKSWWRPPYGQRLPESQGAVFERTLFWNIDSQDWSSKVTAEEMEDRVLTLMLLWRRGILLFHDIHPKAAQALPKVFAATQGSGVRWGDCRDWRP